MNDTSLSVHLRSDADIVFFQKHHSSQFLCAEIPQINTHLEQFDWPFRSAISHRSDKLYPNSSGTYRFSLHVTIKNVLPFSVPTKLSFAMFISRSSITLTVLRVFMNRLGWMNKKFESQSIIYTARQKWRTHCTLHTICTFFFLRSSTRSSQFQNVHVRLLVSFL